MLAETAIPTTNLDRLSRRETRAHDCLNTAVNSWVNFIDELNAIHKEGDWKSKAPHWKAYLEMEFLPKLNYGYERIYQLQAAQPFAKTIELSTGILLNERQTRLIKSLGYEDAQSPATAELIIRSADAARATGMPIKPKHIQSAHDKMTERNTTNGNISLGGESVPTNKILDITQVAIVEDVLEANHRGQQHIIDHSKREKLTVQLERIQDSKGRWRLALPENVPAFLIDKQITFYIEETAKTA